MLQVMWALARCVEVTFALRAPDNLTGDKTHVDGRCWGIESQALCGWEGRLCVGKQLPPSSHLGPVRSGQILTATGCQETASQQGWLPQEESQEGTLAGARVRTGSGRKGNFPNLRPVDKIYFILVCFVIETGSFVSPGWFQTYCLVKEDLELLILPPQLTSLAQGSQACATITRSLCGACDHTQSARQVLYKLSHIPARLCGGFLFLF